MTSAAAPVYLCVHVPEFAAQALLRLRPELEGRAVAVLEGTPPLEQVASANVRAFRLGVARHMTRTALEAFPELCVLSRSPEEERNARACLLEATSVFTPRLELQPARGAALDLVLDLTGTTRLFGPLPETAAQVARAVRALRLSARMAASANLHAAVCMAPAAFRKPILIPAGEERQQLRALPLTALPLTPQQAETLDTWGLRTVGELAALPQAELVARLGPAGQALHQMACGEHPHLLVPEEAAFTLTEYIAFDSPVELLDSLLFVLGPMIDQLLERARNHAFAIASLTLTFGLEGGGMHERTIKPALPVAQRDILLKLAHLDLQAHPPAAGVLSIALRAEPGDRSKMQLGLFAPQTPEPMRLDITLARIAALVGEDRVGRARLLDTHAPDGFVMERFTVPTTTPLPPEKSAQPPVAQRRCRPPVKLSVRSHHAQPAAFSFAGKRYTVQQALGPWRRSGDWWSAAVWSHEEWDVCATTPEGGTLLCVLAHDLLHHHWQMEAVYD